MFACVRGASLVIVLSVAVFSPTKGYAQDDDGTLTPAPAVTEPIDLATTADTVGEAVDIFDFMISDGGTSDGLALTISQIVVHVSGTSTDTERGNIQFRLNGPDVSNVVGTYSAVGDTITFSGLAIAVPDAGFEVYAVNTYYVDNTGLTEDRTIILSVDGDTDLTVGGGGTQMQAGGLAVTNGAGTAIDVTATQLVFTTQPAGSVSGSALTTQPVIAARDAFGNTDVDFTETITLTEASAGSLTNNTLAATNGAATFSNLIYTATADQESFTLTANDQDGVSSDLPTENASAVTTDVVATRLLFSTEPSPTTIQSALNTSFTTIPVVRAADADGLTDTGYSTDITMSEVNGAGSATLSGTGDSDGSSATVSLTPSSGTATFTGLQITYTNSGAADETLDLRASSGGLTAATSTQITSIAAPQITGLVEPSNASYGAGQNLDFAVTYSESVTIDTAGGTPRIALTIGSVTRYASYTSGSGTGSIAFRYTVVGGDLDSDGITLTSATIDLNGGTIRDPDSNNAATSLSSHVGDLSAVLVDAVAPSLAAVTPVPSSTNDTTPNYTFSTNEIGTLSVSGSCGTSSSTSVSASGDVTITLTDTDNTSPLSEGLYMDCAVTVTDANDNESDVLAVAAFAINSSAPTVVTSIEFALPRGGTATLGSDWLFSTDTLDAASDITYRVTVLPTGGTLMLDGSAVAMDGTFTQEDVDSDLLSYEHASEDDVDDSFTFTLSDALGNVNDNASAGFAFELIVVRTCEEDSECDLGPCADGVCCDLACEGGCEACDLEGLAGSCSMRDEGEVGRDACAPYLCDGIAATCPDTCETAADCFDGVSCVGDICEATIEDGNECLSNGECISGYCASGVCCDTACDDYCEACNFIGSEGACAPLADGMSSVDGTCAPYLCDGTSGDCPDTCSSDDDCEGEAICIDDACTAPTSDAGVEDGGVDAGAADGGIAFDASPSPDAGGGGGCSAAGSGAGFTWLIGLGLLVAGLRRAERM